jgi:hypothetical protein
LTTDARDTTSTTETPKAKKRPRDRLRKELTIFSVMVAIGLVVLPFAIFKTGEVLLGDYSSEGHGMGHLYGDILGGLSAGDWNAWLLVLGPWLGVMLLRSLWWPLAHTSGRRKTRD